MSAQKGLFAEFLNPIFIETGSYYGDGIQQALDEGFKTIYSIELSPELYQECKKRFCDNFNVHLILGDSQYVLADILKNIDRKVTFWLDGHHCGGNSATGEQRFPLIFELDAIKGHYIKEHTIIIDDLRCFSVPGEGFDAEVLKRIIKKINKDYIFCFRDGFVPNDILVATI